jgi:hypothetical protein
LLAKIPLELKQLILKDSNTYALYMLQIVKSQVGWRAVAQIATQFVAKRLNFIKKSGINFTKKQLKCIIT